MIETELKLQLPDGTGRAEIVELLSRLQPDGHRRGSRQKLGSTYFDTESFSLKDRGMALRVRETGRRSIQTLKAPAAGRPGLQTYREYEADLPNGQPSLALIGNRTLSTELRRTVWPQLKPLFRSEINRSLWHLEIEGAQVEMAWDRGFIRAGDQEEAVNEVELELKSGSPDLLFKAAEEMLEVVPFRLGHLTKAARGYALASGAKPQPARAAAITLLESDTVATAFEKTVINCLEQMHANERAILHDQNDEAIHQFRVALRRLRATVGSCRRLIDDGVHAMWSVDLRWAQRSCGPARDLDVLIDETLTHLLQHSVGDTELRRFLDMAEEAREDARKQAVQALHNPRYAAMQLQIYWALGDGHWRRLEMTAMLERPVRAFAESQLQSRYKQIRRLGDRWAELEVADLHRLRILGKKLRYVALAYSSLFKSKPTNRFLSRLSDLQDCLGILNDCVVGRQLARDIAGMASAPGALEANELQRILGMVEGWQVHAVHDRLGQLERVWTEFAQAKKFWRM
jgi:inorganic triphosphatase YgiF